MRFICINILFILSLFFSACNTEKIKHENKIESFIEKADKNIDNVTAENWENMDKKMEEFESEFQKNKDKLSSTERKKANEMIGKYYALRLKKFTNELGEEIKELGSDFQDQMNGALEVLSDSNNEK